MRPVTADPRNGYSVMVTDHRKFELKELYSVYEFFKNDLVLKVHPNEQLKIRLTIDLNRNLFELNRARPSQIKYLRNYDKHYKFLKLRNIFKSGR